MDDTHMLNEIYELLVNVSNRVNKLTNSVDEFKNKFALLELELEHLGIKSTQNKKTTSNKPHFSPYTGPETWVVFYGSNDQTIRYSVDSAPIILYSWAHKKCDNKYWIDAPYMVFVNAVGLINNNKMRNNYASVEEVTSFILKHTTPAIKI